MLRCQGKLVGTGEAHNGTLPESFRSFQWFGMKDILKKRWSVSLTVCIGSQWVFLSSYSLGLGRLLASRGSCEKDFHR